MKNKIIIAGSRTIFEKNHQLKEKVFKILSKIGLMETEIVSGDCKGADKFGEWFASLFNLPVKKFPADWSKGKIAGIERNREMAQYGTHLIAIWDHESKGTKNMIGEATKRNLKIRIIDSRKLNIV